MKKMVFICLFFLVSMMSVQAEEKYQLTEEFIDGPTIVKVFENEEGKAQIVEIDIPEQFIEQIESSEEPLQEAKTLLSSYYTKRGMHDELMTLQQTIYENKVVFEEDSLLDETPEEYSSYEPEKQEMTQEEINTNPTEEVIKTEPQLPAVKPSVSETIQEQIATQPINETSQNHTPSNWNIFFGILGIALAITALFVYVKRDWFFR